MKKNTITSTSTNVEVVYEQPLHVDPVSLSFPSEGMNTLVEKVNELVKAVNKLASK